MRMNRENVLIILLAGFIVFMFFYPTYWDDNGRATILNSDEKEFFKPVDVVWRGKIISTMAGGSCVGLEGEFGNYRQAMACLPEARLLEDASELWKFEGMVTITGKWLGITCAYKNTIFGECIPDVTIESIQTSSRQ